jgi:TetR/AcrR family transcriptional regulator, tetracycline repressor protein
VSVTQGSDTREVITQAALAFIDEHGVDELTLRALGQAVGIHHTAIYRHFASRDEVLGAVMGVVMRSVVDDVPTGIEDPRDRLLVLIRGLRRAFHAHPGVTRAALVPAPQIADTQPAQIFFGMVVQALRDAGLDGPELAIHVRILEGYAIGATVFDFAGAPVHLESRRQRYRAVPEAAFEVASRDEAGIDALNEVAFDAGLVALVDACLAAGRRAREENPT